MEKDQESRVKNHGYYGELRKNYILRAKRDLYDELFRDGELDKYLDSVNNNCISTLEMMYSRIEERDDLPDKLLFPVERQKQIRMLKLMAQEFVLNEYVYE